MAATLAQAALMIRRIGCYLGRVPARCYFSYGQANDSDFFFVRLQAQEGWAGWGETKLPATPAVFDQLAGLLGYPAMEVERKLDVFAAEDSIRALEAAAMASLNLIACASNQPLCRVLGRPRRWTIPLMPVIFAADAAEAAQLASALAADGFRDMKLKLLGDLNRDLAAVEAVRRAAPGLRHLVGDANLGYAFSDLADGSVLCAFRKAGLTVFEDPCPGEAAQYATLRRPNHPLLMIDQMARSRDSLRAVLDAGSADLVNLHPCQQGTFREAIARAKLCARYRVPAWIGGTGYLGVGSYAYHHLAAVIGLGRPCGELDGSYDHGMPRLVRHKTLIKRGQAQLHASFIEQAQPDLEALEPYLTDVRVMI